MSLRKLLLIGLIVPASAFADSEPQPVHKKNGSDEIRAAASFLNLYRHALDCENVGYIQTGEADEHFAPIFLATDIDGSKSLSLKELQNYSLAKNRDLMQVSFTKMDKNGNGSATAEELRIYLNTAVATVDSDNDGDVFPIEYQHALNTGTLLSTPVPSSKRTKAKQPDFVPPWIRHAQAVNHKKAAKKAESKKPTTR